MRENNEFYLSGRIRCMETIQISLSDINGEVLLEGTIGAQKPDFSLGPIKLFPDLYVLKIGSTVEHIYIGKTPVHISGYYDNRTPAQSNLKFEGMEAHFRLMALPFKKYDMELVSTDLLDRISGTEVSSVAFHYVRRQYDYLKPFYDRLNAEDFRSSTGQWLQYTIDSLQAFASGIPAPEFALPDVDGNIHRLEDYEGKLVVLDFWASWCGPCRRAMEKMKAYYPEFKDKVQFISISVDDHENRWRKAEEEEQIPWLSLWDSSGFRAESAMRTAYGFQAIPFIVLIDAQGQVLRRDIGSAEQLKEVLDGVL
jgi:thiol-disulfide isomerase/thioredoxin